MYHYPFCSNWERATIRTKKQRFRKVGLEHRDGGGGWSSLSVLHGSPKTATHRHRYRIPSTLAGIYSKCLLAVEWVFNTRQRTLFLISTRSHETNRYSIEQGSCTVKLSSGTLLKREFTEFWLRVRSDYFELEKFHEYNFIFYNVLMWNKCSLC